MAKGRRIKILVLPTAKADLGEIVDFISQGSRKYAILEKRLIIDAIEKLIDQPELGKPFDHRSVDARQLVFRNYLIIYRLRSAEVIEILTIHHHARSIGNNRAFPGED